MLTTLSNARRYAQDRVRINDTTYAIARVPGEGYMVILDRVANLDNARVNGWQIIERLTP